MLFSPWGQIFDYGVTKECSLDSEECSLDSEECSFSLTLTFYFRWEFQGNLRI